MCGILGVASVEPLDDTSWIVCGSEALKHRGPDDHGLWVSDSRLVALAHRRLAVLDLSSAGHQPMVAPDRIAAITFNGEIYNHLTLRKELQKEGYRFRSRTDTEVILAAYVHWGTDCIAKLEGMFAFAIHDVKRGQLLLARDRAGEKPLYLRHSSREVRFASEIKGLLADPKISRTINHRSLHDYLSLGFVPGEESLVNEIRKLPPGHAVTFDCETGAVRTWRYWDLPPPPRIDKVSHVGGLTSEAQDLLDSAVGRQLVADVPVGVFLSGGLDSSLITALAAAHTSRLRTFTVTFPGFGSFDEAEHARVVAKHFGTEHTELDGGTLGPGILEDLAWYYDDPIIDSSVLPTSMLSELVRQHCTVALGGDGGDELFGGYRHYSRILNVERRTRYIPRPFLAASASLSHYLLPVGFRGRNWAQSLGSNFKTTVPQVHSHFDSDQIRKLVPDLSHGFTSAFPTVIPHQLPMDPVQLATRADFYHYLAEDLLVKVDRASMRSSLELRSPFLSHEVVDFAFGRLPSSLRATRYQRKIVLRKLAEKLLPADLILARKQGFSVPLQQWLAQGPWRDFFMDVLRSRDSLFDRNQTQRLVLGLDKGRDNSERLFGLVFLDLWRRTYSMTL